MTSGTGLTLKAEYRCQVNTGTGENADAGLTFFRHLNPHDFRVLKPLVRSGEKLSKALFSDVIECSIRPHIFAHQFECQKSTYLYFFYHKLLDILYTNIQIFLYLTVLRLTWLKIHENRTLLLIHFNPLTTKKCQQQKLYGCIENFR